MVKDKVTMTRRNKHPSTQGAFVGMLTSLIFTMWIGMGQVVAQYFETYSDPAKNTTIAGCPPEWLEDIPSDDSPQ